MAVYVLKGLFAMDGIEAFRTKLTAWAIVAMVVYLVVAQ